MMYDEFVKLSGQEITYREYTDIVEPMYMAAENMSKQDFVKFITPSCKALVKEARAKARKNQKAVFVSDGRCTPNGCYYIGHWYKLVGEDTDISTGMTTYTVREMDDEERDEHTKYCDMYLSSSINIYEDDVMTIICKTA